MSRPLGVAGAPPPSLSEPLTRPHAPRTSRMSTGFFRDGVKRGAHSSSLRQWLFRSSGSASSPRLNPGEAGKAPFYRLIPKANEKGNAASSSIFKEPFLNIKISRLLFIVKAGRPNRPASLCKDITHSGIMKIRGRGVQPNQSGIGGVWRDRPKSRISG